MNLHLVTRANRPEGLHVGQALGLPANVRAAGLLCGGYSTSRERREPPGIATRIPATWGAPPAGVVPPLDRGGIQWTAGVLDEGYAHDGGM